MISPPYFQRDPLHFLPFRGIPGACLRVCAVSHNWTCVCALGFPGLRGGREVGEVAPRTNAVFDAFSLPSFFGRKRGLDVHSRMGQTKQASSSPSFSTFLHFYFMGELMYHWVDSLQLNWEIDVIITFTFEHLLYTWLAP